MKKARRKVTLGFVGSAFDGYRCRVNEDAVPELQALHAEHTPRILHWYTSTKRIGNRVIYRHNFCEILQ